MKTKFLAWFDQAIQMSGSTFAEWASSNRVIQETEKLAAALKCDLVDSKLLKKCLRGKSVHEILDGVQKIASLSCLLLKRETFFGFGSFIFGIHF